MNHLVLREDVGQIAVVTLNRPARHNSLIPELLEELLEITESIGLDETIRAMVLQANGRSFSTGGDAQGFVDHLDRIEEYSHHLVGLLNKVILSLIYLPVPIIAAVNGIVTGGSIGIVLACDIVLVSEKASFTPYYSVVGVSPDGGWTALLPSIIGRPRAASVIMLNETIAARQALDWGIACRLVPADQIQKAAIETAETVVGNKPGSIFHTKKLLNLDRQSIESGLEAEREHFVQHIVTLEGKEAFVSFLKDLHATK